MTCWPDAPAVSVFGKVAWYTQGDTTARLNIVAKYTLGKGRN